MRVQIPAYTDRWMMGDRFGEVVKEIKGRKGYERETVYRVKLDKSRKIIRVIADDCTVVCHDQKSCAVCGRMEPEGDCCTEAGK